MRQPPRPADLADAEDLVKLVQSAYRGDASRQGWTTEADLLGGQRLDHETAAEMITEPDGVVLLLRDPLGEALGSMQLRDLGPVSEGRRCAYFGLFAVAPHAQGAGLGSHLISYAEDYARHAWDAEVMRMTVISIRTELIAYYERRGYQNTGRTEPFPYGDERFGDPKRDDLEFTVLLKELPAARQT